MEELWKSRQVLVERQELLLSWFKECAPDKVVDFRTHFWTLEKIRKEFFIFLKLFSFKSECFTHKFSEDYNLKLKSVKKLNVCR